MPLKTFIVIALRLYAIYWLVESIARLLVDGPFLFSASKELQIPSYQCLLLPLGMFLVAGILWASASGLSSKVTNGYDTQLAFTALTKRDLYCFAFVFLGIYFALSSIYPTVEAGFKFFTFDLPQSDGSPERGRYLWPFLGHAFTMIAGFICFLGAEKWTAKLIRLENKQETPPPSA